MSKTKRKGASFAFGITFLVPSALVTVVVAYLVSAFSSVFSSPDSTSGVGSSGPGTGNSKVAVADYPSCPPVELAYC